MTDDIDNGGYAFPIPEVRGPDGSGWCEGSYGLSVRDWFAGHALAGMNASCVDMADWPSGDGPKRMAISAYAQADAMIAERAKRTASHE